MKSIPDWGWVARRSRADGARVLGILYCSLFSPLLLNLTSLVIREGEPPWFLLPTLRLSPDFDVGIPNTLVPLGAANPRQESSH